MITTPSSTPSSTPISPPPQGQGSRQGDCQGDRDNASPGGSGIHEKKVLVQANHNSDIFCLFVCFSLFFLFFNKEQTRQADLPAFFERQNTCSLNAVLFVAVVLFGSFRVCFCVCFLSCVFWRTGAERAQEFLQDCVFLCFHVHWLQRRIVNES